MSRRKVGVARIKAEQERRNQLTSLSKTMDAQKSSSVSATMAAFKECVTDFAQKHRSKINEDPEFRMQFNRMCKSVGVDPLASSKGFWSDILGYGDFYFELGVVIVQLCLQSRSDNGGLMSLSDLLAALRRRSDTERKHVVSEDDVLNSIEKLSVLGGGFRIVCIGGQRFVTSTPLELSLDHEVLIAEAQARISVPMSVGSASTSSGSSSSSRRRRSGEVGGTSVSAGTGTGGVTESLLRTKHGWSAERFHQVLTPLLYEGIAWLDQPGPTHEKSYEFPTLLLAMVAQAKA